MADVGSTKKGIAPPRSCIRRHRMRREHARPALRAPCHIPWLFKLLGAFAAIVVQIPFTLDGIGIYSAPAFVHSTRAEALSLRQQPGLATQGERVIEDDPAAMPAKPQASQRNATGTPPEFRMAGSRPHPWLGDSSALVTGLLLLGASDPALRPRFAAAR